MWQLDHKEGWVARNWCFLTVCWRRLLPVRWTARRSNQSILKEINPEYSLEGLVLKLKLQYFGHVMWKASSLEKTLKLGKIDGRRRRGLQEEKGTTEDEMVGWHYWLNRHVFEQTQEDSEGQGTWRAEVHGITKQQPPLWSNFNHLISDPMFKYSHFGG